MSHQQFDSLSPLARLVELHDQMQTDAAADESALRKRDRDIALQPDFPKQDRTARVRAWLAHVREPAIGEKVDHALRLVHITMIALGLLIGIITAAGLFRYTGAQPVNVIYILAVFVGLQLLLLLIYLAMALSAGRGAFDTLSILSPGRLVAMILRRLDQSTRESVERAFGAAKSHTRVFGRVHKWLVLYLSQGFAVAFNVGAIAAAMCLIVFTDLAFGWSTTLQAEDETFHRIVHTLAAPWSDILLDADPTLDFIKATRFYRLDVDAPRETTLDPAGFGGWWPFLITCMVVYGFLPRVVTLCIARWRYRRSACLAMADAPGVAQLFDRMHAPLVQTQAQENEPASVERPTPTLAEPEPTDSAGAIINWSDVDITDERATALCHANFAEAGTHVLRAGGSRSVEDDQNLIREIAQTTGSIVVLVRAFEPPMGDFLDFLTDLRQTIGDRRAINVAPIAGNPEQRKVWRDRLATLGDPWLAVRHIDAEAAP